MPRLKFKSVVEGYLTILATILKIDVYYFTMRGPRVTGLHISAISIPCLCNLQIILLYPHIQVRKVPWSPLATQASLSFLRLRSSPFQAGRITLQKAEHRMRLSSKYIKL